METIPFRKQHKLPKLFSSEEVRFNVMVCIDGRHWLYRNSFDSLEDAERSAEEIRNEPRVTKTIITKEVTKRKTVYLKDTVVESENKSEE